MQRTRRSLAESITNCFRTYNPVQPLHKSNVKGRLLDGGFKTLEQLKGLRGKHKYVNTYQDLHSVDASFCRATRHADGPERAT